MEYLLLFTLVVSSFTAYIWAVVSVFRLSFIGGIVTIFIPAVYLGALIFASGKVSRMPLFLWLLAIALTVYMFFSHPELFNEDGEFVLPPDAFESFDRGAYSEAGNHETAPVEELPPGVERGAF